MNIHGETCADFHTAEIPTSISSIELINESIDISEDCHCCGENLYIAGTLYDP